MNKTLGRDDAARMIWVRKRVNMDGTARDGYVWPVFAGGGWVQHDGPSDGAECGVGLHLGKTVAGLSSGGSLVEALMIVVGYLPEDVLGEGADKVRVRQCYVVGGATGFCKSLRSFGTGANLGYANLGYANLEYANLEDANLAGARYNKSTIFPTHLDPTERKMVQR